ncbi:MAG: cyclic nucleotide-binding domain-containing protein [Actinomycetota bacterium]
MSKLTDIPLFAGLSKGELKRVERLMVSIPIKEGRILTTQGKGGREFLIIEEGTAKVEIDDTVVAHLGPGEFLGELSLITGDKRTATITATSPMQCQVLNRGEFNSLLDENPKIARKILVSAVRRLAADNNRKLD